MPLNNFFKIHFVFSKLGKSKYKESMLISSAVASRPSHESVLCLSKFYRQSSFRHLLMVFCFSPPEESIWLGGWPVADVSFPPLAPCSVCFSCGAHLCSYVEAFEGASHALNVVEPLAPLSGNRPKCCTVCIDVYECHFRNVYCLCLCLAFEVKFQIRCYIMICLTPFSFCILFELQGF